jgi:hypothetical protein
MVKIFKATYPISFLIGFEELAEKISLVFYLEVYLKFLDASILWNGHIPFGCLIVELWQLFEGDLKVEKVYLRFRE